MIVYTDSEAITKFDTVLDQANADGAVRIRRTDGSEFVLRPAGRSPLDVGTVKTQSKITAEEIVAAVREGRERDYTPRREQLP